MVLLFFPAHIPTHLNVKADINHWTGSFQNGIFSLQSSDSVSTQRSTRGGLLTSSHTNQCQHYYTLKNLLPLGVLGLNAFNHPWTYYELCIPSSCSSSLSSEQVSGGICHRSIQLFYSSGTLLDSLACHSSQHFGRHSWLVSYCKKSCHGCFGRQGALGSALIEGCSYVYCADKGSLHQSVRWWWGADSSVYNESLTAMLEIMPHCP